MYIYIYIYIYVCVCVCVKERVRLCVCVLLKKKRGGEERRKSIHVLVNNITSKCVASCTYGSAIWISDFLSNAPVAKNAGVYIYYARGTMALRIRGI